MNSLPPRTPSARPLLVTAVMLLAAPAFAGPAIQDGEWEFTVTMDGSAMPMAVPPVRFTNCLTKKDPVPRQGEQLNKDCKMVRKQVSGNSVNYTMRCESKGVTLENVGTTTFSGATMTGTVKQTMKHGDKVMHTSTAKMTGKRIGACKAKK